MRRCTRAGHLVPLLALAHLLGLAAARAKDGWAGWARPWAASAFGVLLVIIARDFITARRKDRLPDVPSALAWAAAGSLEIHALSGAVAASRLVPACLFPAVAYLLPAAPAAAFAAAAAAWLSWSPGTAWPSVTGAAGTVLLAIPGLWAGAAVRRALASRRAAPEMVRKAIDESRALLLPWEDDRERSGSPARGVDELGLIREGQETVEGLRRVLEGLLPMTGADVILYVSQPEAPGHPFVKTVSVLRAGAAAAGDLAVPDSYVPVREATVFRRPFSAGGEEAGRYVLAGGTTRRRPTGIAAVPVAGGERVDGAILALRFAEGDLTEAAIPSLEMGAYFAARELAAGRQSYRAAHYYAKQEAFHNLVRKIAQVSEEGDAAGAGTVSPRRVIYRETAVQALSHLDADRILLIETDARGKKGRVAMRAARADGAPEDEEEWLPLGESYAGWVVRNGTSRIFDGLEAAPGRHPVLPARWAEPGDHACLLLPVREAPGFSGLVACLRGKGRTFQAGDAEAAGEIVRIMKLGLSHALRLENLEHGARRDGLTGLLNQKTFRDELRSELARLDGRHPCAVLMLDLDHFKRVNDGYGHPAGDEVLKRTAALIAKTIRKADFAGRYGGEEFAIFLAHADRAHALRVAERLRLGIRQAKFVFAGKEIAVTASLGIACCPEHGRTAEEVVARADEALYRSKREGRDRVTAS